MKYMIMIYHNPASRELWEALPQEERSRGLNVYTALDQDLAASGEMIASEALADPAAGRRVTVSGGGTLVSDGPVAEAKEHLAGFYLVECASVERAIELASRIPEASLGLVEVRPVIDLSAFEK
jgi:hypothetical protein